MSRNRARAIAISRRRPDPLPWLPWLLLASVLVAGAAMAQTPASPGAAVPLAPPASPIPEQVAPPSGSSPAGSPRADTPGGTTRNGVATPLANPDPGINRGAPTPSAGMPVIPPPGSPGGNPTVVPK